MFSFDHLRQLNPYTSNVTSCYNFDEDLFNNFEDGSNLMDIFRLKSISNIRKILEDFSFKPEILEPCNEFISSFENILFLHVRRGDSVVEDAIG